MRPSAPGPMPAGQEALRRVLLPALRRLFRGYIAHRAGIQKLISVSFVVYAFRSTYSNLSGNSKRGRKSPQHVHSRTPRKPKIQIDSIFYTRLVRLLRIVIPSWRSAESAMLGLHTLFLVLRTLLSLYVADLDGRIVSSLVRSNTSLFALNILKWLLISVPACYCNAMLDYLQSKLALAYRTRLTEKALATYLDDAQDDTTNSTGGQKNVGAEGLVVLTVLVQATAGLPEEIGFYRGHEYEKNVVERGYYGLVKHVNRVLKIRAWHGVVEEGIVKWLWGSFGLCLCAIPVFVKLPGVKNVTDLGSRTEGFVTNRRLLLSSSDAFGRIMYSYKELAELAGYTARVSDLLDTMDEVEAGKFKKQLVSSASTEENAKGEDTCVLARFSGSDFVHALIQHVHAFLVLSGRGQVVESADIRFENVPIVSPNGDILVKALSFEVKQGENLVVQGPNGCGKSSLFRILGGLWPVYGKSSAVPFFSVWAPILSVILAGGTVHKPSSREFTYIPQRPYLTTGTLRDQLIYPQNREEFIASGKTDHDLHVILQKLQMTQMVEKEGGFDAHREWRDTLSGGDKQKIAMARLFYHRPKYAILDESSSAVPLEVEKVMYEQAVGKSHFPLPSDLQYHERILEFDGQGGYIFAKLDASRRLALQEERQALERKLEDVPKLTARLEELEAIKREREKAATGAS
ncbi:hypothetical protein QFC19_009259 [Naganishia cerealis]|uniref:Uncharacterized protein n=1 Tax=Naganishia cerealis TaxID=610337 RepID=A0ACC2UW04_9TREE|nr:hypothetical protein QFC19_009259 [Naganishia cerealis]